jgi:uncharacterized protein (DUF1778 family)
MFEMIRLQACHDNVWQICYYRAERDNGMPTVTRTEKLDLRLTPSAKRVLQSAATAAQRSVSEFVLESALARAEETLPDRQRFGLNADRWSAFQAALDSRARPNPRLKKLLQKPSVFERRRK